MPREPLSLLLLAACALSAGREGDAPAKVVVTGEAMGGPLQVVVRCSPPSTAADCRRSGEAARAEILRIEALATDWRPTGQIARLNAAAGQERVPVDPEVAALLADARRVSEATGGAFDVTINALWGLWDFSEGKMADPAVLAERLPLVGYSGLHVESTGGSGEAWLDRPGMSVTLGGIAQGYAAERALRGIPQPEAMVDLSGDVAVRGTWTVGVQHPRAPRGTLIATLRLTDAVIETSGDYEKFFVLDGVRHHHILDPRTGMPARGAISATVVHPEGSIADALATALLVTGPRAAPVEALGAWALVVLDDGRILELGDARGRVRDLEVVAR